MASNLSEKLLDREIEARQLLIGAALKELKALRVRLDGVFKEYDDGADPFLKRVQPELVREPVEEYLRLMKLQTGMSSALEFAQSLSRRAFWFLACFVVVMFVATVLGVLVPTIGTLPASLALAIGGVLFVVGGGIFGTILLKVRSIDAAHVAVGQIHREEPYSGEVL